MNYVNLTPYEFIWYLAMLFFPMEVYNVGHKGKNV